jgi:hypothetical protein
VEPGVGDAYEDVVEVCVGVLVRVEVAVGVLLDVRVMLGVEVVLRVGVDDAETEDVRL